MRWLIEAAQDNDTKRYSSTRVAILLSSVTLSISTLALTIAVIWNAELVPALSVVGGGLAGMSGGSYMANRFARPKLTDKEIDDV